MSNPLQTSPSFRKLLAAVTLSGIGAEVSAVALPLVALLILDASAYEIGILAALAYVPVIIVTPFAGVLSDRYPPRIVNGLADITRGVAILFVPTLAWMDLLSIPVLFIIALAVGVIEAISSVAHHSILPAVVPSNQIEKGNTSLSMSYSVTEVAGPGLGGVLVQFFGAPIALLVDSFGFLASGILLLRMKTIPRKSESNSPPANWFVLVAWGFKFLWDEKRLLWLGICGGVSNMLLFAFTTVLSIFIVSALGLEPWAFGAVLALGAVGGVVGALVAGGIRDRVSLPSTLLGAEIAGGIGVVIVSLGSVPNGGWLSFVIVGLGMLVYSGAMGVYNVHSMSTRQLLSPPEYLGRVTASYRLLSHGAIPLGAILGGVAAGVWGSGIVILAAGALLVLWALALRLTPFMQLRTVGRAALSDGVEAT